jgi:hypothetical protein
MMKQESLYSMTSVGHCFRRVGQRQRLGLPVTVSVQTVAAVVNLESGDGNQLQAVQCNDLAWLPPSSFQENEALQSHLDHVTHHN